MNSNSSPGLSGNMVLTAVVLSVFTTLLCLTITVLQSLELHVSICAATSISVVLDLEFAVISETVICLFLSLTSHTVPTLCGLHCHEPVSPRFHPCFLMSAWCLCLPVVGGCVPRMEPALICLTCSLMKRFTVAPVSVNLLWG